MERLFDLNIEKVLEHWGPEHAVREIIANALDEQILTGTENIKIEKIGNSWHIRDFGRGLQYSHFTQKENAEKTMNPHLIGRFGVGLKDALGVFHRYGIGVEVNSKYGHISLKMASKPKFDIQTLHAVFNEPIDPHFVGTDFILSGVSDDAVETAKSMFIYFNKQLTLLEKTKYGEVYQKGKGPAIIYINGVQIATEDNFLFCYNITNIDSKTRSALNRERTNVGRTAYTNAVKNTLLKCESVDTIRTLIADLKNVIQGTQCDESNWIDVATYAAKKLAKLDAQIVFMTPNQNSLLNNGQREILERSAYRLILVTDNVYNKIRDEVRTFNVIYAEYNESFVYNFIPINDLTVHEKSTFNISNKIITFLKENGFRFNIDIKISETIRMCADGSRTLGVYDSKEKAIIIKRSILADPAEFCGTLLHEFAHFQHGFSDNTRDFENDLTDMLGKCFYNTLN